MKMTAAEKEILLTQWETTPTNVLRPLLQNRNAHAIDMAAHRLGMKKQRAPKVSRQKAPPKPKAEKTKSVICPVCDQAAVHRASDVRASVKRGIILCCSPQCGNARREELNRRLDESLGDASPASELSVRVTWKPWTYEEEQIIRANYPRGGPNACKLPGRSFYAIQRHASKMKIKQSGQRQWQLERIKLNAPLVESSRIAKQFREWSTMTARQCRAGLLIRLEIVDELPRLFAQKRNCPPPLSTPHTIGIYRSPTAKQVLNELLAWDEKRTINALRAA